LNLTQLINILRGSLPKSYFNLRSYLWSLTYKSAPQNVNSKNKKSVLLIRPDGIGDFIQWLPYGEKISEHFKKRGISTTLLGNVAWLDYSKNFNLFDNYIEFNRNALMKSSRYRSELIEKLNSTNFSAVINIGTSREFFIDNSLIRFLNCKEKIGYNGESSNDAMWLLNISSSNYTKLIDISNIEKYEPKLNEYFLENLNIDLPAVDVPRINITGENNPGNYFILIPGSNMNIKQWNFKNFTDIAKRIIDKTGYECIICGGKKELSIINESNIDFPFKNMINKTSLLELTELIAGARLLISNDTGSIHIATGLNIPSFCIYGGGHFGRFLPYKSETKNILLPCVIYNKMDCFNCNWKCKYNITKYKPAKCIENVTVEQVWKEIELGIETDFKNLSSN